MIYLAIYLIVFIGLFIYVITTAPMGYEDETGFHYLDKGNK